MSAWKRAALIATAVCLGLVAVLLYTIAPASAGGAVMYTQTAHNATPSAFLVPDRVQSDRDRHGYLRQLPHVTLPRSKRADDVGAVAPALIKRTRSS